MLLDEQTQSLKERRAFGSPGGGEGVGSQQHASGPVGRPSVHELERQFIEQARASWIAREPRAGLLFRFIERSRLRGGREPGVLVERRVRSRDSIWRMLYAIRTATSLWPRDGRRR